jgi:hypothetical protein
MAFSVNVQVTRNMLKAPLAVLPLMKIADGAALSRWNESSAANIPLLNILGRSNSSFPTPTNLAVATGSDL